MKKLLITLLLLPLLSFAEMSANKPVKCFDLDFLHSEIERGQEHPFLISKNTMTGDSTIILFRNEKTGTWTLIEFKNSFGCVLGFGVEKKEKSL